jgi:excisionase family DNA binding protein
MPEPDDFLTLAEVASILKLNHQTVCNWIDRGILRALVVRRRVRTHRFDYPR